MLIAAALNLLLLTTAKPCRYNFFVVVAIGVRVSIYTVGIVKFLVISPIPL